MWLYCGNFFRDEGLNILFGEAEERLEHAHYSPKKLCNVYLGNGNTELPDDHP